MQSDKDLPDTVETWILTRKDIGEVFKRWIESADYTREPADNAEENADYFISIAEGL